MALEKTPLVEKEDGVTVVTLGPEFESIDETLMDDLREFLLDVSASAAPPRFLLDLSHTQFFGSSFIELLFRIWNRMNSQEGGRFAICGLTSYCREVLEITHLDQLWSICPTKEEALVQLGNE